MTQEEKALYEAIKKAKEIKEKIVYSHLSTESCKTVSEYIDTIIPELAESEDERVRKALVKALGLLSTEWLRLYGGASKEEMPAYLEKQKEQKHYWKPTETDVALFNKAVTTNKTLTPAERAQLDIIRSKFGCCRAVNCNGIVQKEQKPAEWSDSFEEAVADLIERAKQGKCDSLSPIEEGNKLLAIVKHGKVNQQEWSEEDFERLVGELVQDIVANEKDAANYGAEKKPTSFFLTKYSEKFKSLRPHWKPSEEQMEALLWCTAHLGGADHRVLAELYEHLKMYCL